MGVGQEQSQRVVVRPLPRRFKEEAYALEVEVRPPFVIVLSFLGVLQEEVGPTEDKRARRRGVDNAAAEEKWLFHRKPKLSVE